MTTRRARERELQPGDEVAVTLRGVVRLATVRLVGAPDHDELVIDFQPGVTYAVEQLRRFDADVVVTLPVDHPSRDPVFTVRGDARHVWIKTALRHHDDRGEYGVWWDVVGGEESGDDDERVVALPVLGVLPGTSSLTTTVRE